MSPGTRVKICGITDRDDLAVAVDAGADAIGLISEVPVDTPREIAPDRARALAEDVPPFVTSVLVTMSGAPNDLEGLLAAVDPDVLQVHGNISTPALAELRPATPIIRALDVADEDRIRESAEIADAILIDSTDTQGAGGTGEPHDWDRTRAYVDELDVPIVLAGGLTPANVADAVGRVGPYAVDVASGVEGEAGKDPAAVDAFVAAAKGAGD